MLVYFYSSDRNGNRKTRSRCFWYITGNKIIEKEQPPSRSGSDPAGNFCARSAQSPACSAPSQALQVLWMLFLRHLSFMSL